MDTFFLRIQQNEKHKKPRGYKLHDKNMSHPKRHLNEHHPAVYEVVNEHVCSQWCTYIYSSRMFWNMT